MTMLTFRLSICVCIITALKLALAHDGNFWLEQEKQGRISGGNIAHEHQFPYQVGLNIEENLASFTWCGGSIISNQWIITAAHCVAHVVSILVYLGSVNRLQPALIVRPSVEEIELHPEFNRQTLENDIALLHLPEVLIFSDSINAIRLPKLASSYDSYEYSEAITSGWGRMSDTYLSISNELRFIVRYVESNEDCRYIYGTSIKSSNICMDTTGGESTCTGDSGGPLISYDHSDNSYKLIGLTSFGKSSGCTKGFPAVFTRITSYLSWIHEVTGIVSY